MIAPTAAVPKFHPGQLVQHSRYGYRGVVVEVDSFCKAPDRWYDSNKTQPDRNQPWYHVLVHGCDTITYAAQTSLEPDDSGLPVEHPLTDLYFSEFTGSAYVRNDRPWGE